MKKDSKIQIIGGGTFGLSTAYHLAQSGYTNITIIDREEVPSSFSAGYDLNKIVRPEYEDQFYTNLALDSIELWESPEFSPFFQKVGYVNCNSADAPTKSVEIAKVYYDNLKINKRIPEDDVQWIEDEASFKKIVPQLDINFQGWKGYFNKHAGYANAYKAMVHIAERCKAMGVKFKVDRVESLVVSSISQTCLGVLGGNGVIHQADLTILALGAHITSLLPELHVYVTPKSWSVGHIQASSDECEKMKGMPVFNCRDIGFCFEPDEDTNKIKFCNNNAGWTNFETHGGYKVSQPTESNDGVCDIDDAALKRQAQIFFPQLNHIPISEKKICWCCDRENSDFVIDYHPSLRDLFLVTADSGHAFKMFPIIGKWVLEKLENKLDPALSQRWRWFHETKSEDAEVDEISWRLGKVMDLKDKRRYQ